MAPEPRTEESGGDQRVAPAIPRVIHRVWLGGPEPEWTRPFAQTWRRGDWILWEWDDESVQSMFPLANQAIYDAAEEIAPNHVGQLRSDILRYEILHRFGGVYVDTDFECLRPIDPLIEGLDCFAARVTPRWINNAILGCTPGHHFFRRLIDAIPASVKANRGSRPNRMTGPHLITRLRTPDLSLLPARLFYPFSWDELDRCHDDFPDAYAKHWWANQHRERGLTACP